MLDVRVFPCLLLQGPGLVKTVKFKKPQYIGDPMNAARIFSAREADEALLLDISAGAEGRGPDEDLVSRISDECFMPLTVGGGIRTVGMARALFNAGAEKIAINSAAITNPELIGAIAAEFGSQSVVVSIDAKRKWGGYEVYTHGGRKRTKRSVVAHAQAMAKAGAGEILINAIDRDGMMQGYDVELTRQVADAVDLPVIACGGAGSLDHMRQVVEQGHASAVTAGSFFVFHGRRRAVLISFPDRADLEAQVLDATPA
ncbi:MAG: AglZ/HisF2 family acetamidino modification protein [Planctomycetota bacterium]